LGKQQRVPSISYRESLSRADEHVAVTAEFVREASAPKERIEFGEDIRARSQSVAMGTETLSELAQDPLDFFAFLCLELANAISEFDCRWRLDE
jgi:hypothetical protein